LIHLQHKIQLAEDLLKNLQKLDSPEQKASFLLEKDKKNAHWIQQFSAYEQYLLLCPIVLGQGKPFIGREKNELQALLVTLDDVERFYETIGGIIGYHLAVLKLLAEQKEVHKQEYLQPVQIDIQELSDEVYASIRSGIEQLHLLAELYPVGGAGDRLALICPEEFEPLPAAQLPFLGVTLLEGLIRDLQAREYLHFQLTGNQVTTPVALMTSHEKANDLRMTRILEENLHFGRPAASFRLFKQPMVPVMTDEGDWVITKPMQLQLKPGGHGAVWRLAVREGVFDWFQSQGRTKGLVRQINNPIAGIDYGLLAFTGIGLAEDKAFGFAACPRMVHNAEGTDVLVETKDENGYTYTLSNIEYTEFERRGIEDRPAEKDGVYSAFPANTNILFFDIDQIRSAVKINPIPGMILNMKSKMNIDDREVAVGRLESTMQNISDVIASHFNTKPSEESLMQMPVYLTYNVRRKTLSVAKNSYDSKKSAVGTPEGCFYELMENMHDVFSLCGVSLPPLPTMQTYLQSGPSFHIHYHPALGPLFYVIAQKIRGGKLKEHSELILHIAEIELVNLDLDGSFLIHAEHIMGKVNASGILTYGPDNGKCTLLNCKVVNKGVEKNSTHQYWKQDITRTESLHIDIQGNGEFFAENVTFKGSCHIVVRDQHRVVVEEKDGKLVLTETKISKPTWNWRYSFDRLNKIVLDNGQ
jgi:hypothetical protein